MNDEIIRQKLKDRNLAAIARNIGVSRSYLSKYMSGKDISEATKQKLISYLLEN